MTSSDIRDFSVEQDENETDIATGQQMPEEVMEHFIAAVREVLMIKEQKTTLTTRESQLKGVLMDVLVEFGDTDLKGHKRIPLDPPVRGYGSVVRQRKVVQTVDANAAEAIARVHEIYERLFRPVMVLDEDAVLVAREEGLITDDDITRIFPKKIQYAFVPEREK